MKRLFMWTEDILSLHNGIFIGLNKTYFLWWGFKHFDGHLVLFRAPCCLSRKVQLNSRLSRKQRWSCEAAVGQTWSEFADWRSIKKQKTEKQKL